MWPTSSRLPADPHTRPLIHPRTYTHTALQTRGHEWQEDGPGEGKARDLGGAQRQTSTRQRVMHTAGHVTLGHSVCCWAFCGIGPVVVLVDVLWYYSMCCGIRRPCVVGSICVRDALACVCVCEGVFEGGESGISQSHCSPCPRTHTHIHSHAHAHAHTSRHALHALLCRSRTATSRWRCWIRTTSRSCAA